MNRLTPGITLLLLLLTTVSHAGTTVSGNIACPDFSEGNIYVRAYDNNDRSSAQIKGSAVLTEPGAFSMPIEDPVPASIWITAFYDKNGSGATGPEMGDLVGWFNANPVSVSGASVSGIDITINSSAAPVCNPSCDKDKG